MGGRKERKTETRAIEGKEREGTKKNEGKENEAANVSKWLSWLIKPASTHHS